LQLDHYKSAGVADSSRGLLSAESLQQLPDASKNILDVISNQLNNPNSSYNQDIAHTSGEKRILQINEIPTLRSLYRSRQLLQLDQSYAPNDSYNRMISFCNHDLTKLEVDAIVNNAPLDLRHSPNRGTLHQAIMEAGGPNLVQEARSKPKFKLGQVELTHGHGLPSSWIFHAAVPTFAGKGAVVQYSTLGNCYRNALDKAADLGIRTIAFPCLGTGGCGFSPRQAARTALQAVREDLDARSENKFERIVFCVKSAVDEKAYMDFFPVFFPPTHGDLDMARKSNRPARYAVLASRVMDTRVQVQESTAALSSEFGGVVPEIENDYISLLAEIDSALASIHHALLGPENLEEHSDDLNLLCFVLSTLSTSITKMVATAERKARTGATHREILEVTDWSMNGKYGSDLKQFLLHCSSFANGLNHVMMRKKTVWDITKMRSRMESYRAKEIRRDAEDVSDQPDEATSAQHSIPTASSDRNLVNPHQIPSVARLYQLGAIKAKHTLARPSTAFNRIVCLAREDMTKLEVDVIVNSTDTSFLGMGTLDRTIFKKGGSDLQEEVQKFGECREGDVKTTPGYLLPAKHIVHVIPPKVFKKDNKNMLRNIYREILHTATFLEAKSVAIPCIGTGTLNYPLRDTASLAMEEVRRFLQSQEQGSLEKIIFAVYSSHDEDTYKSLLPVYFPPPEESVSKSLDSRTRRGPERPSIWRWVCCSCGGDNSYKTDKVCSGCHNHWRDSRCKLYDANIRDSETVDTSPSGSILNTGNSQSNAPEDPSRSMPVHDSPAMIKAKVSILNGLEATPEPVHKDWCIVHVLGSSVNVYKKSESSKDPYLVLSLDLVLDTTWPRRTALLGVTIKNVQITSEPPGDKVTVYFQCENSEDKTVLYSALFAAVTHVRQQQNIERRKDQEVADEQESDLDLVSTAEKREDVTNTRDDAHSPDVESQVHDEQHGNDMVPPGDQQSQDSDSIATPGSEHNDASRDSVSNPEESHQGYQTDGLEEEDDDEDINRERRRQRRLERQRRKEGIENVKREGRYPPYLYMIINHLTEDLHQRPASYIGQHIDSISSALDIDTTTLSAHLRVLAAQGKVHTTVDDETWVVSGYENTMVPPLPEERDENRVG
jgi:O-acetyl-ADP-ribose deacetylase (regulator of RNase III)